MSKHAVALDGDLPCAGFLGSWGPGQGCVLRSWFSYGLYLTPVNTFSALGSCSGAWLPPVSGIRLPKGSVSLGRWPVL